MVDRSSFHVGFQGGFVGGISPGGAAPEATEQTASTMEVRIYVARRIEYPGKLQVRHACARVLRVE